MHAEYSAWFGKLAEWAQSPAQIPKDRLSVIAQAVSAVVTSGTTTEREAATLIDLFAQAFMLEPARAEELLMPPAPEHAKESLVLPPVPLREDSFLARYTKWLETQESPTAYHVFAFLTAYSAGIYRRGYYSIGGIPVYPNLYTVLVGPSGARKDSAFDYAINVMETASPDYSVSPSEGSPQGLVGFMQERYNSFGTTSVLLAAPELKVMFGTDKYKESLVTWVTDWFKCQPYWSRIVRAELIELHDLYVCLLGGCTEDWLVKMPTDALTGGFFMARVLLVNALDKKHWCFEPRICPIERDSIAEHVALSLRQVPHEFTLSKQAKTYYTDWYETVLPNKHRSANPKGKTFYQRAHVHALKISCLLSLLDGKGEIDLTHATDAVSLTEWVGHAADPVLANLGKREPIYDDVVRVLTDQGGSARIVAVTRKLRNTYKAHEVRRAIDALVEDETLKETKVGGKRTLYLGG